MATIEQGISCYEVMAEINAVTDEVLPGAPVFLVGGGPAAAIRHESTRYDHESKRVIAYSDSAESTVRTNGSLRDLDLVAMRVLEGDEGQRAEKAILEAIGGRMVVSVFGLEPRKEHSPLSRFVRTFADWTSRRTIDENGIHRYEIYPLEQTIDEPEQVYEEWALELPMGGEIAIMPPDTTVLNYSIRSVSPRPKDQEKLAHMKRLIEAEPEFVERMHGPLQPIQELADAIVKLGNGQLDKDSPLLVPNVSFFGRGLFRAKAGLNTSFGKNEEVVKLIGHNETVQRTLKFATGRK
jgi:hypothetical protein